MSPPDPQPVFGLHVHPYDKPEVPSTQSFRQRGLFFRKRAGTNRKPLPVYMRQSWRDWVRYAMSALVQWVPALAPRPEVPRNTGFCVGLSPPHPTPPPPGGREHVTDLKTNLAQRYHYAVAVADPEDFSFVVVGDTGMNSPGQYLVSSALSRQDVIPSDFCMILGDVMYPAGGMERYPYGFFEAFRHYAKPVLALPGNHDWYDNLRGFRRVFVKGDVPGDIARRYGWESPKLPNWFYYSDFGTSLRVICLDTGMDGTMKQNERRQLAWLDGVLASAGSRKVVVMMHHPLFSLNARGHETVLRERLMARLDKANVVAVFSGHDHNYQRHEIEGRQYVIQGAGGATLHPLPDRRVIRLADGGRKVLTKTPMGDRCYALTHCRWRNNRLTCTTVSAHELPNRILDQFVL